MATLGQEKAMAVIGYLSDFSPGSYAETFPYIEWRGLPKPRTGEMPHHNAQKLFGLRINGTG
jgi:hypothetical protein